MIIKTYLNHAPWLQVKPLIKLFSIYQKAGYEIRPVGGCIRDTILNSPINDWDLTTNAAPEKSLEICKNAGLHVIPTGLKHGTITAIFNHVPFEITTLRIDEKTDGRHAKVIWTADWEKDAHRRDFTINALYGDQNGNIYDYTGGLEDIEQNIIRFVGNAHERVREDYLRILRYFRFMAHFGDFNKIDTTSLNACIEGKSGLKKISGERIRDEIFKTLVAPRRDKTIKLMSQHDILKIIKLSIHDKNLFALDVIEKELAFKATSLRALAYLLPTQANWAKIAHQLKLSNKQTTHLLKVQKYLEIKQPIDHDLLRKICYDIGSDACQDVYILKFETLSYKVDNWDTLPPASFPVSGKDLIDLGIKTDKNMGKILKKLEKQYIDSNFSLSKKELLKAV